MTETNSQAKTKNDFSVKFVDPEQVIKNLEINSGMRVADFGCGAGHFSLAFARKVGEEGIVYALDILPDKLEAADSAARSRNLNNIITRRASLERENGSELEADSLDWVILKDMLFQNKNKKGILDEAKRVLKPGGKILVIEWNMSNNSIGPGRELRLSKEALVAVAQQVGLGFLKDVPAGNFHFGAVLVK